MISVKRKIRIFTVWLVFTITLCMTSIKAYELWSDLLEQEYKTTGSIARLLDVQLVGSYEDLLRDREELKTKEEKINYYNEILQPIVDRITQSFPQYGAGYYVHDLQSIVAFGPDFTKEGLIDISPTSLARTVYDSKQPYRFYNYSQTRNSLVVAVIHPVIRDGEVIGHVWGNMAIDDVYQKFFEALKTRSIAVIILLILSLFATKYITTQYDKSIQTFRDRVKNMDLDQEEKQSAFLPEFREIYQEVVQSRNRLSESEKRHQKQMTRKILETQEEERKRVARDLHDGIGQALYSLLITLRLIGRKTHESDEQELLNRMEEITSLALEDVKSLAFNLRPAILDELGLVPTIRAFIESYQQIHRIQVNFQLEGETRRLDSITEVSLYRIFQEVLNNAAKYSKTDRILIQLKYTKDIELFIQDFGVGFDSSAIQSTSTGLCGMKERVQLLDGSFHVHSVVGVGTRIHIILHSKDSTKERVS
ncbi:histidine kinase [Ammoniphilus sp. CFH 90114]|uniref:histidine kinase n=1 Tax=Ammoniphilus sp. CFH 90114 TaxID=2493665 RepID=UPI00100F5C19|nr:histidine kinase [Ammoniphilus sp. CFH 90114]RXT07091.1 hypothetical protein EIZ39_13140 [Ammoniphilus sp. CFH 90114]